MRVIKFRAWDDKNKKYWFSDDEAYLLKEYNGVLHLVEDENFYREGCKEYYKISDKLQQFTGLTDKNGKDIYEGDILNMENGTRNPYTVSWDNDLFAFLIDGASPMGNPQFMSLYKDDIEVIGNIHEGIK